MRFLMGIALAMAMAAAAPAQARWLEASSDNFVIYADDSEKDIARFAQNLESYHRAMEILTNSNVVVPSPSNRVGIYVVGDDKDLRDLYGDRSSNVAGFYIPRAAASRAFVPNLRIYGREPDFSLTVLLHEYAHHFQHITAPKSYTRWLVEGSAEYYAAARFLPDGSVEMGNAANHRADEVGYARNVSIRALLDHETYEKENSGNRYDDFYGRSWLLYHYLTHHEDRAGQLDRYIRDLASGTPPLKAAENAFGDFDKLEKDMRSYLGTKYIANVKLGSDLFEQYDVAVRAVSDGHAEMMPVIMQSERGVSREEALSLLPRAREIGARYPGDAAVQAALAEAEFDAGNAQAAIEAADRAIAADPENPDAYVQKGFALFSLAEDIQDPDEQTAAVDAAMIPFSKLNRIEPDHPLPLIYYYRSFGLKGLSPTENARVAIEQAAQLSPFDNNLWLTVASLMASEGKIALARDILSPIANNPHEGSAASAASGMIEVLEDKPDGEPVFLKASVEEESED